MKTTITGILLIVAACSISPCKKDLVEYNPAGATAESLLNTPEGFEAAVNGAYTYNRNFYGKEEGIGLMEAGTDIWTSAANDQQPMLTTYLNFTPDQTWIKTRMWQQCYAAINLCNQALKYINDAGLSVTRKPVLESELRFMRAWYYWHLVETFGDVHFTLQPTESIITTVNRTPAATVYDQIFADVTFATANLPVTTTDYGRITRPAAEAFLSRLYLTRGKNQEAAGIAAGVIRNYPYRLLANYADLWNITNQRNNEVLWAVNYSTNLTYNAGSNVLHTLFLMDYSTQPGMLRDVANGLPNLRYMPTLFLLNLFNETDDARFNASFKQAWLSNQPDATKRPAGINVGDTAVLVSKYPVSTAQRAAKKYKIFDVNDVYNTNGTPKDRFHYISLKKFDDPTRAAATETQSSRDAFIIRLAKVYLIAAEAQFKLGKSDSAAYYLNQVRTRAALAGRQAAMQVAPAAVTLDVILDERAREFAGEQLRWFDLKRTGKLVERVKLYNPDAAPYIRDFHVVRPLPQSEIDAATNKTEFKQNTGY